MPPSLEDVLDKYKSVKTGQDLINLQVIPKTSAASLAWMAFKRLESLHALKKSQVTPEMLGTWQPLFEGSYTEVGAETVSGADVVKYAKEGMIVSSPMVLNNGSIKAISGKIIGKGERKVRVRWDEGVRDFDQRYINDLGFVSDVDSSAVVLQVPGGRILESYGIAKGAVADEKLGHKVIFNGSVPLNFGKGKLSPNEVMDLVSYDAGKKAVYFRRENGENLAGIVTEEIVKSLYVSSLGQIAPKNLEDELMTATFADFFPRTVLDTETARSIVTGILMEKDMVFHGPPGAGKTQVSKDIIELAKQQRVSFVVDGCKVQCNPYSLFDAEFAEQVPACPECKINYSEGFKETNIFLPPKPGDIRVKVVAYGEGMGIEHTEGTSELRRMHLAGFKLPNLNGSETNESEYDPQGFHAGVLGRTNNGVWHIDELDKVPETVRSNLLDALQSSRIKPDQLRFSYPANTVVIGTANDTKPFSGALNDRMLLLGIYYPTDNDVSYSITRRSYYGEKIDL